MVRVPKFRALCDSNPTFELTQRSELWGAVITPAEGAQFTNTGEMCFSGTSPIITDGTDADTEPDYGTYYGAGMGFDVCAEGDNDTNPGTKNPMGNCPFNAGLATQVIGIQVDLTGTVDAGSDFLRIQFSENDTGNPPNAYVMVQGTNTTNPKDVTGTYTALFADAKVSYDPSSKKETDPTLVKAIQFQVPGNASAVVTWDFCVTGIRAVTAAK